MDGKSLNITEEKINSLKEIIPEAFTENKIDWEKLKAALGDDIEFKNERYVLNWAGKSDAFRVLQSPTSATLSIDQLTFINDKGKVETVNAEDKKQFSPAQWSMINDKCPNVFIEGENLEVLKVLQKSYFGKIKMIYIDPPYNTGNDSFIYPDKFSETREEYLNRIGDKDEAGYMTREGLFRKNSKDSGHYHSNWLSMIYPRLFLARNLLKDDGVIFVSIDDNEVHNLRLIMNEVFGEENFIANVVWEKKYTRSNDAKWFSDNHDHILVFGREKEKIVFNLQKRTDEQLRAYSNPDKHPKGEWKATPLHAKSGSNLGVKTFMFKNGVIWQAPKGTYRRYNDETMKRFDDNNEIWFGEDGKQVPQRKSFLCDVKKGVTPITIWKYRDAGHNHEANEELKRLNLTGLFTNPKPSRLIRLMTELCTDKDMDDIILDFFAGSCTTAHAVLALNKENGGRRKFICVQLPEKCDENSEAYKAGYKTIAEIGKERIRRVMEQLTLNIEHLTDKEKGKTEQTSLFGSKESMINDNCSTLNGFRVFKLRESNFKIWRSKIETEEELIEQLQQHLEPLDEKAGTEDVLYELLLKSGVPLTAKIEEKNGYMIVNDNEIALILEKADNEIIKNVIAEKPGKVITLDRLFKNNDQLKTNTALQMKDAKIEFKAI